MMFNSEAIETYKFMPEPDTPEYIGNYLKKVFDHMLKMQHQQCESSMLFKVPKETTEKMHPKYRGNEFKF